MLSTDTENEPPQNNNEIENNDAQPQRSVPTVSGTVDEREDQQTTPATQNSNQPSTSRGATSNDTTVEQNNDASSENKSNNCSSPDEVPKPKPDIDSNEELEDLDKELETITIDKSKVMYRNPQSNSRTHFTLKKNTWVEN